MALGVAEISSGSVMGGMASSWKLQLIGLRNMVLPAVARLCAVRRPFIRHSSARLSSAAGPSTPQDPTRHRIPGEVPGGPKPIVYRGLVLNSKVPTGA
jgi:hypothetical protein